MSKHSMNAELQLGMERFQTLRNSPELSHWLQRMYSHDRDLYRHSLLTGVMASLFCRSAALKERDAHLLVTGALLHDVGKLSIRRETLQKNGPLTLRERAELECHPERGTLLLQPEGWGTEVLDMVHHHHERLDGSGYPEGLADGSIRRLVRMLMLCDVFSALIEPRSYRPSPRRPIEIMAAMGEEFDGELLRAFSKDVPDLAYQAQKILQQEELVIVFAYSQ